MKILTLHIPLWNVAFRNKIIARKETLCNYSKRLFPQRKITPKRIAIYDQATEKDITFDKIAYCLSYINKEILRIPWSVCRDNDPNLCRMYAFNNQFINVRKRYL